jgi:hypothetical protein
MVDQIFAIIFAVVAGALLVTGIRTFVKGESSVYGYKGFLGKSVMLTGAANYIVAIVAIISSTISLLAIIGFWFGMVSSGWVFIVFAASAITYRLVTSIVIQQEERDF